MGAGKNTSLILMKYLAVVISLILVSALFSFNTNIQTVSAQNDHNFISEPGNIPYFGDWETPVLEPGEKGYLKFSLENRYDEQIYDSNNLTNIELTLGVYKHATLEDSNLVTNKFENAPEIFDGISKEHTGRMGINDTMGIITIEPDTGIKLFRFFWPILPQNITFDIELKISTDINTPEGTYFIKTNLTFNHAGINNRTFEMRSLGHYSKKDWETAKKTATEDYPSSINLTFLKLDGITPETSFSVRIPMPFWPFYVLAGITGFFAVLAMVFYYMEEHGKFPTLKAKLDKLSRKRK